MKIRKPITIWDKIQNCIIDVTGTDEPLPHMNETEMIEKIIELAYHYRFEYNKKCEELEEITWQ